VSGIAGSLVGLPWFRRLWLASLRLRNERAERRPTEVEPGVFVGGIPTRRRWDALQRVGVTRAVCLLAEAEPDPWMVPHEAVLWLPVPDRAAPSVQELRSGCAFLDAARAERQGIFIYCGSGMGRAPTMYLAWHLRGRAEDIEAGVGRLRAARVVVSPTGAQLMALERWGREFGRR
jgi:polymorphic toxin system DSP-PTPase phosphatase-like protein